jgi:hypothetical protein
MEFKPEDLLIAVFGVLPGFVSSAVRQTIAPVGSSSAGEWVARSMVASMAFNLVAAVIFSACFLPDFFSGKVGEIEVSLHDMPRWGVLVYLGVLYGLAIVWGATAGLNAGLSPRLLAYRLRLTPISPTSNVFNAVLENLVRTRENLQLRGKPELQVPWLRVERADKVVIGRLMSGTVGFKLDQPIEVFLSPALVLNDGSASKREILVNDGRQLRGLYLRVRPEDVVEIFTARADWRFSDIGH